MQKISCQIVLKLHIYCVHVAKRFDHFTFSSDHGRKAPPHQEAASSISRLLRNVAAVHLSLTLKPQLAVWNERLCETQLQTQLHAVLNTHTHTQKKNP